VSDSNRLWVLGTVLGCAVILALGWFFGVSPMLDQIGDSNTQKVTVDQQNRLSQARIAKLKADYENLDEVAAQLDQLRESMPPTADYDGFLGELNSLAGDDGVTLTGFVPADPEVLQIGPTASPTPGAAAPAAGEGVADGAVVSIPVQVNADGTYSHLVEFLGHLQAAKRLYLVASSTITGTGADYSMAVNGYIFVEVDSSLTVTPSPTPAPTISATPSATND
jgi:Tfp pilus assembly protein PilO